MLTKLKASTWLNYLLFICGIGALAGTALSQISLLGKVGIGAGIVAAFLTSLGTMIGLGKSKLVEMLPDEPKE
jgi:hypothetical protein